MEKLLKKLKKADYSWFGTTLSAKEVVIVIDALEKQVPKEPIKERSEYRCPVCEEYVGTDMIGGDGKRYMKNYCEECGQRIE